MLSNHLLQVAQSSDDEGFTYQPSYRDTSYNQTNSELPPIRSTAELNLLVLRRHYPTISSIHATASHAQVYLFNQATQGWEKQEVCGPLFVVEHTSAAPGNRLSSRTPSFSSYAVVILNRSSLENFHMSLWGRGSCEVAAEYVIVAEDGAEVEDAQTYGLWIHPGADVEAANRVRSLIASTMLECAEEAEASRLPSTAPDEDEDQYGAGVLKESMIDRDMQRQYSHGQAISLTDLFGSRPHADRQGHGA